MNAARNYLKHGNIELIDPTNIDLQNEAIQQITQAIINLLRLEKSFTSETVRFFKWLERLSLTHRPRHPSAVILGLVPRTHRVTYSNGDGS